MTQRKRMKQPKETTTATIRLEPAELDIIDAAASRIGISRSLFVARAALAIATADEDTAVKALNISKEEGKHSLGHLLEHMSTAITKISHRLDSLESQSSQPHPPANTTPAPASATQTAAPAQTPISDHVTQSGAPAAQPQSTRHNKAEILQIIEQMRLEQRSRGIKSDNRAIANRLNSEGLTDSKGGKWNASQITTWISRSLPHLKDDN